MPTIVIATANGNVSPHFGSCPGFTVVQVEDGRVASSIQVANPGHDTVSPPKFVASLGANVVIVGGIGKGASDRLEDLGIDVRRGITGTVEDAVAHYLTGTLEDGDGSCAGHDHHGSGHSCTC